jgi:hypothetical protein
MYAFGVMYGGPRVRGGRQLNDPSRFLHVEVLGGRWGGMARRCDLCSSFNPRALEGTRRVEQPLGPLTIAGHRGELFAGRAGQSEFAGHLSFLWHTRGLWHVVSLHAWRSRPRTLAVLRALIAGLAPAT